MINSYGYITNGINWKLRNDAQVKGAGHQQHAEIAVYNKLGQTQKKPPYLIVQNAFPCKECHKKFITASKGNNTPLVIKITANQGSYSDDHGLGQNYGNNILGSPKKIL